MFFDNKVESHSLVMGASGKGKSVLSEQVRKNARLRGDLLVDTEMYREGRGLKPYEHEYARRLVLGLSVTNGAIVIHTQRLKSDPGGNLLS